MLNDPGAHPIDVVDVGMPNDTYRLSDIRASIDGVPLTDISNSPYVTPGRGRGAGQPRHPARADAAPCTWRPRYATSIYQDSDDDAYASIEFAPTWFDSQFVHGATRLEVNFHLPPGVTAEEPRYHDEPSSPSAYFRG